MWPPLFRPRPSEGFRIISGFGLLKAGWLSENTPATQCFTRFWDLGLRASAPAKTPWFGRPVFRHGVAIFFLPGFWDCRSDLFRPSWPSECPRRFLVLGVGLAVVFPKVPYQKGGVAENTKPRHSPTKVSQDVGPFGVCGRAAVLTCLDVSIRVLKWLVSKTPGLCFPNLQAVKVAKVRLGNCGPEHNKTCVSEFLQLPLLPNTICDFCFAWCRHFGNGELQDMKPVRSEDACTNRVFDSCLFRHPALIHVDFLEACLSFVLAKLMLILLGPGHLCATQAFLCELHVS